MSDKIAGLVEPLPDEQVIADLKQGIIQRGLDLTSRNNIILTNRRLVVVYKKLMSVSNSFILDLKDVTVVSLLSVTKLARAIVAGIVATFLSYLLWRYLFESRGKSTSEVGLLEWITLSSGVLCALVVYFLGRRVAIHIAIPGFSETIVDQSAGYLPLLLLIVLPPVGFTVWLFSSGQHFKGDGLFYEMRRGLHTGRLRDFVNAVLSQKRALEEALEAPPTSSLPVTITDRLNELTMLHAQGLITDDEFHQKRAGIVQDL